MARPEPLGQRIQQARVNAGLSQQELAAHAQVSIGAITTIEQGRRYPSPVMLAALVDAIGTDGARRLPEYHLARARDLLDERVVGLEPALRALKSFADAQQRLVEDRTGAAVQRRAASPRRGRATGRGKGNSAAG